MPITRRNLLILRNVFLLFPICLVPPVHNRDDRKKQLVLLLFVLLTLLRPPSIKEIRDRIDGDESMYFGRDPFNT